MIDTDKYTGHTEGPWWFEGELKEDFESDPEGTGQTGNTTLELWGCPTSPLALGEIGADYEVYETKANALLMADAPLILQALIDERAEVERLREELEQCWEYISHIEDHDMQNLADDSYREERDRLRGKLNE
jgi:hypothetical protein